MSAFADTSFLFAFYFPRAVSEQAVAKMESLQDAPLISSLVRYEFQQAVWFKVWLHTQGQPLGLSEPVAQSALAAFELDVEQRVWAVASSEQEPLSEELRWALTPSFPQKARAVCRKRMERRAVSSGRSAAQAGRE